MSECKLRIKTISCHNFSSNVLPYRQQLNKTCDEEKHITWCNNGVRGGEGLKGGIIVVNIHREGRT